MQGFVVNEVTVTGITTAFDPAKAIKLVQSTAVDANSKLLPQAGYYSHVAVTLEVTAGLPTTVQAMLCWDADGDHILAGPTDLITLQAGLTTAAIRMFTASISAWPTATADQTTIQAVYLFLLVDVGTVDCTKVELFWSDRSRS
jgi:hypothetical protein